ncbi:MAG: PIN domain-containing protein, partial [Bacillota bacterium]|nr:PIN domain-containing protein [Bacillota bacterium]
MSKSIIVPDTNILTPRPFLDSGEWTDLHARVDDWQLRFLVPEVVLLETVNVVRRKWRPERTRLEQLAGWTQGFGMRDELQAILAAADNRDADYEVSLRSRIDELGAEIVPLPATIDHLGIARRASERRAPYGIAGKPDDGHAKDGYRDTLIWLTVLDVAEKHPECDVWFVSNNYSDFGAKPNDKDSRDTAEYPLDWHSELALELDEIGLAGRVFYARSLRRLEQHLLSTFSPLSPADRDALWGTVDLNELDHHMTLALFSTPVDPRSAALPLDTTTAMVTASIRASDAVRLSEAAKRAAGAWTARFTCEVKATIEVARRSGDVAVERKPLILSGRIDLTADSHVSALTVESIKAKADDPQHRAWDRAVAAARMGDMFDPGAASAAARMGDMFDPAAASAAARMGDMFDPAAASAAARM